MAPGDAAVRAMRRKLWRAAIFDGRNARKGKGKETHRLKRDNKQEDREAK